MTVYLDADVRNADWTKFRVWDFPTDADMFLQVIGGPQALEHFMTLPVAEQMPPTLRVDLAVATGVKVPMKSKADFTPSLHPRDDHGRFTETPGGGLGTTGSPRTREDDHRSRGDSSASESAMLHHVLDQRLEELRNGTFSPSDDYGMFTRYVAANGHAYVLSRKKVPPGKPGFCNFNVGRALAAGLPDGWAVAGGYWAGGSGHTWLVNDEGQAVDPTGPRYETERFGVTIPVDIAMAHLTAVPDAVEETGSSFEFDYSGAVADMARSEGYGSKAFDPVLHPHDPHTGEFTRTGGGLDTLVDTPDTTAELHDTFVRGAAHYRRLVAQHGGPPESEFPLPPETFYQRANVKVADPEDVPADQKAICEKAAADFLANPRMQPIFDAYGTPEIAVASHVIGSDELVGDDPREKGIMAQWIGGTVFLYGGVAGDPPYAQKLVDQNPGFAVGGSDLPTTMMHEYGHQVMGVTMFDEYGDDSEFITRFKDAIIGDGDRESIAANTDQLSTYAGFSTQEAFAEAFATVMDPEFNIDDYDGGMRDALQILMDKIAEDTPDPNQGSLFA